MCPGSIQQLILRDLTFFKIGGTCDAFCEPSNIEELQNFLFNMKGETICVGAMSNVLLYDGHISKNIVHMSSKFSDIKFGDGFVYVTAGCSIASVINACINRGVSCIEDMTCIPGTIGGALIMNAGIADFEIFNVVQDIHVMDMNGNIFVLPKMQFSPQYRNGNIPKNMIIIGCTLYTKPCNLEVLRTKTSVLLKNRRKTQPLGQATCGSTFKNPPNCKAWQLIDAAGCRGLSVGDAVVSTLHCNFIINNGCATFNDVIQLINMIKNKVKQNSGIVLEEEIKIIT